MAEPPRSMRDVAHAVGKWTGDPYEYLRRMMAGGAVNRLAIDVKDNDFTYSFD